MAVCLFIYPFFCSFLMEISSLDSPMAEVRPIIILPITKLTIVTPILQAVLGALPTGKNFSKSVFKSTRNGSLFPNFCSLLQCYIQSEEPRTCLPQQGDYLECLHHRKEVRLSLRILRK